MNCKRKEYGFSIKPTSLAYCAYFHITCKSLIKNSDHVNATCARGYKHDIVNVIAPIVLCELLMELHEEMTLLMSSLACVRPFNEFI